VVDPSPEPLPGAEAMSLDDEANPYLFWYRPTAANRWPVVAALIEGDHGAAGHPHLGGSRLGAVVPTLAGRLHDPSAPMAFPTILLLSLDALGWPGFAILTVLGGIPSIP
jgi:hypothetical protein